MVVEFHLLSTSALNTTSRPGRFTPRNNVVSSESQQIATTPYFTSRKIVFIDTPRKPQM